MVSGSPSAPVGNVRYQLRRSRISPGRVPDAAGGAVAGVPARGGGDDRAGVVAQDESCRVGFLLMVTCGGCTSELSDVSGFVVVWCVAGPDDSAAAELVSSVFAAAGAVVSTVVRSVLSRSVAVDPG
jgi:hypothetical protein